MRSRRAIAVMVSRFPLVTETFILRELMELERQGQPVLLVPMLRERPAVVHEEAKRWVQRALYTPYLSAAIVEANAQMLLRRPLRYFSVMARLILGSLRSPGVLARTMAIFPKSVYLARELQRRGIRHVHAHFVTHPATMAVVASELADITFSVTAHAHDIFVNRTGLASKLRRATFVRAISKFNRDFLSRLYPHAGAKIEVIHVGIDPSRYGPASDVFPAKLVCVAALKPYKGVPVLIAACQLLAARGVNFDCEIIGEGPLLPEIQTMIAAKKLASSVRLLGNLTQSEVATRIGAATLVVLPSIVAPDGQMEGIPVALMEAMACRRPVVASNLSGIPELVEHGVHGLLVQPGNPAELADAIQQLLKDRDGATEMGRRGREKILQEFTLFETVRELQRKIDAANPDADLTAAESDLLGQATVGVRQVHERADSRVVEILAGGSELVVKTHKSPPGESRAVVEVARHEFEILQKLSGHGLAPRPLRLLGASILMERAEGSALDGLIRELRDQPEALAPAFGAVGMWLRTFRQVLPDASHGDLWPGNIFISEDLVQVIDFEGVRSGNGDRDVSNFLTESRKFFARPQHRRHFARLRQAFREGYEGRP